jgi:hypothetical protein
VRCVDCERKFHPVCMDYDHRDGTIKVASVARLVRDGAALTRILSEIEKCDPVCACCHRLRTMNRLMV